MSHPISLNETKSRISEGCFFSLGSFARYKLEKVPQENDAGTDYRLIKQIERNGSVCDMGGVLDFQVKSTQRWNADREFIRYKLNSKNYNDIISRNKYGQIPIILILMCLHDHEKRWIEFHDQEIIFRKNMFWFHTDSIDLLENENSTKTIKIPRNNRLNVESFAELVENYSLKKSS